MSATIPLTTSAAKKITTLRNICFMRGIASAYGALPCRVPSSRKASRAYKVFSCVGEPSGICDEPAFFRVWLVAKPFESYV